MGATFNQVSVRYFIAVVRFLCRECARPHRQYQKYCTGEGALSGFGKSTDGETGNVMLNSKVLLGWTVCVSSTL